MKTKDIPKKIIGNSASIQNLFLSMSKVAPSCANILIQGESGTGKELFAHAIHEMSNRSAKPFRAINCASIPGELLESELFGHRRGAFTGASGEHIGLFEATNGGTIFLDEIGDMPTLLQAKILRVLQDSKIRPVGSVDEIDVDIRIVAATHQNLAELVKMKKFREDLYFRLNVVPLLIPPLRDRLDDLDRLVNFFVTKFSKLYEKKVLGVDAKLLEELKDYHWPGNIRELENTIERAVLLTEQTLLGVEDFTWLLEQNHQNKLKSIDPCHNFLPENERDLFKISLGVPLRELESRYIQAYCRAHPNKSQGAVASRLGINRKTLYRKFQEAPLSSIPVALHA